MKAAESLLHEDSRVVHEDWRSNLSALGGCEIDAEGLTVATSNLGDGVVYNEAETL